MSLVELKTDVRAVSDAAVSAMKTISDIAEKGEIRGFIIVALDTDKNIRVANDFVSRIELLGALEYAKGVVAENG